MSRSSLRRGTSRAVPRFCGWFMACVTLSGCCWFLPAPQKITLRRSDRVQALRFERCSGGGDVGQVEVSVENLSRRREVCAFRTSSSGLVQLPSDCGQLQEGDVYKFSTRHARLITEIGPSGEPIVIYSNCE